MKFNLQFPYSEDYKAGYLINGSQGRKVVVLVSHDGKQRCTAYARYLMAVKSKRYLNQGQTVDHINEDKTDDRLQNLQILPKADNIRKHAAAIRASYQHGTYRMYARGRCRCQLCKQAKRQSIHRYYVKHRDQINRKRRQKRAEQRLKTRQALSQ